jgi:putative transposase
MFICGDDGIFHMKAYRYRIYPGKAQEKQMQTSLFLAKELWNSLLEHCKAFYNDFGKFPTRGALQIMAKDSGLHSQVSQEVAHRVEQAVWRYAKLRKTGKKAGFPRFKSIDRMKSLHYPQYGNGFLLGRKLRVTPFGEINIRKHREIKSAIKTLSLKREASGKWFACFCVDDTPVLKAPNGKPRVGMDLGLKTLVTLSDGSKIGNPRHLQKHAERLAALQRHFSGKRKGSQNRKRMKRKVAIAYEKIKNTRTDFLHKVSHSLVNSYSFIALENLASQETAERNFGKQINDAGWGELAGMLRYKAESAGCEVVFVNPKDTTKTCCMCKNRKDVPLAERAYLCDVCGSLMDRDLNAAHNMLAKATAGTAESKACGDGIAIPSLKQDALPFGAG